MATTGELRAIVEELALIDDGDAATYLGQETNNETLAQLSDELSSFLTSDELAAFGLLNNTYLMK